ncbi:MAG: hypothetical protein ICV64_10215 [Thermoleophilia bacterium]|nr:hypothetical protein [Thermoleophilia bacterium]
MAHDDWRITVELAEQHGAGDRLLERLGVVDSDAEELEEELREARLAATHEGSTVFVYADSAQQAERARAIVERELADERLQARSIRVECWLPDEDRWDAEPPGPTVDEEVAGRGYAPWEVRVECDSYGEARELAEDLEREGLPVVRRWRYVLVGASTREQADELARRLHGEVEAGGELVWEVLPTRPFVLFPITPL